MSSKGLLNDKAVLHLNGRTVKGYTNRFLWNAETLVNSPPIKLLDASEAKEMSLEGAKAIFFVRSFEGTGHDTLRFHDDLAPMECLWVRATFHDAEVIEGLISNTCAFVLQDGFFMSPTDPEDNNWLIFILKRQLKNFEVLGLRSSPWAMPLDKLPKM